MSVPPALASETHERRVHVHDARLLDELELDRRGLLELDEDVEPTATARATARVRRVRDGLELAEDTVVQEHRAGDEAGGDQVGDPAVDERAGVDHVQVAAARDRGPRLHADQAEDVLVLRRPDPEPEGPQDHVQEDERRPRGGGRQEQERHHQQRPDDQADDHPDDRTGELRGRGASELVLEAGHGAQGETSEHPTGHVADPGTQEDVQERSGTAGLGERRAELEPAGRQQGDEDQADAFDQAPLQSTLATLRRGFAHPLGSFPSPTGADRLVPLLGDIGREWP